MDRLTRLPIKSSLIFLIITEILVWIGPIDYNIKHPLLLIVYLAIVNYALYLGYVRGVKIARYSSFTLSPHTVGFLLVIGLICTLYTMYVMWAARGYSLSLSHLMDSITDPGEVYNRDNENHFNASIVYLLVGPFQWASIPLGIFYWRKLSKFLKGVVILTVLITIATWLGIGTRKGIFDLMIVSAFLILAKNPSIFEDKRKTRLFNMLTAASITVFLCFFIISNLSRGGLELSEITEYERIEYKDWYADHLSTPIVVGLSDITSYVSGGYQMLSLGLNEGIITPTVFGMSMSTANYSVKLFGYDPLPDSYMQLIQNKYGYDKYENWHTIYLWLANDFTFIFVPLIIFLIGFFLARVWVDSIHGRNPFAFPVMGYLLVMVFYFFANNQVLSFSLESFIGCVVLYGLSKVIKVGL